MAKGPAPRIAVLGFSIECNAFAPPATRADFEGCVWLERDAITADARARAPIALPETPGFYAAMDATGPWQEAAATAAQRLARTALSDAQLALALEQEAFDWDDFVRGLGRLPAAERRQAVSAALGRFGLPKLPEG